MICNVGLLSRLIKRASSIFYTIVAEPLAVKFVFNTKSRLERRLFKNLKGEGLNDPSHL